MAQYKNLKWQFKISLSLSLFGGRGEGASSHILMMKVKPWFSLKPGQFNKCMLNNSTKNACLKLFTNLPDGTSAILFQVTGGINLIDELTYFF